MAKLRKQRKRKTYRYNVNRKRMRNKMQTTGKVACKEIREAWDSSKSLKGNLENMGLSYDPNKTIAIGKNKVLPAGAKEWSQETVVEKQVPSKTYVAEQMEKDAKEPRKRLLQLPNSQVNWVTYLMDKYGTDYKAMVRDKKNHYQETWKQLRAKINRFKGIPEQYSKYLEERGITNDLPDATVCSDDDE